MAIQQNKSVRRYVGIALVAAGAVLPLSAQEEREQAEERQSAQEVSPQEGEATSVEATPGQETSTTDQPGNAAAPEVVPTIPVAAAATTPDEETQLDDIVVTASKRSQLLSEVGASVSALSGNRMKSIGATNFQDLATYLPGVSSASGGAGQNEIVVRGIAAGPEGYSVSSTVGVYLDELPVGSSTAYAFGVYAMDVSPFDLDRVELLSGPQGTLYGAGSLGGLLKYVTEPPDVNVLTAAVQGDTSDTLEGGSNRSWRGVVNAPAKIPFTNVPLGLRVNYFDDKNAGLIDDPDRGKENVDASTTRSARASLLTQFAPDLTLRLTGIQQDIDRGGASNVDYDGQTQQPVNGQYEHSTRFDEPFYSKLRQYAGVVTWNTEWGDFTSVSGWADTGIGITSDQTEAFAAQFGTGELVPYRLFVGADLDKFTQEVRFSRSGTWLDWQLGGYYTHESAITYVDLWAESQPIPQQLLEIDLFTDYKEQALFGNTTFHISDDFDLGLGGRYATNDQTYQQFTGGTLGTAPSDTSVHHGGDKSTTYLINPVYRLTDSLMFYARAASGYRPGGPNYLVPPPTPQTRPIFHPDTVWNYELGSKMNFGNVSLNLSVFRIDWKDIQLLVNENNFNTIINGRTAQVEGVEASTVYAVARGWTIAANATYTRAELSEDAPELEARKGAPLPLTPKFGGALATDYRMPLWGDWSATMGASYRHIGERPQGFDGSTVVIPYLIPAYDTLDLRAGIQWKSLDLGLIVKNTLDTVGQISADTRGYSQDENAPVRTAILQPRTTQLTLTYSY